MLLDEPFAGVDPIAVSEVKGLVRQLTQRGIGVLITDHSVRETLSLVDRAYLIHDGRVMIQGKPDVNIAMNGMLGGAVAITANCHVVTPAAAIAIGLIGGIITTVATIALERWQIDDPVGAVPVHFACGWWGTLCVALFNEKGFDMKLLGIQTLGVFAVSLYSFLVAGLFFIVVRLIMPLRATEEEQINGLDFSEHAANAYPDFQTTEQA